MKAPAAPELSARADNSGPATVEEMPPAAQALAAEMEDARGLAERALRRAMAITEETVWLCDASHNLTSNEDYFPVRGGRALAGAELDAWIARAQDDAALRMLGRGVAYLLKHRELQDSGVNLSAWVEEQGLKRRRVYEDMAVARMYAMTDEGVVRRVGQLPARKQIQLASLPAPVIERLVEAGDLDEMARLPLGQFRAEVAARQRLEKRLVEALHMIDRQHEEIRDLKHTRPWRGELPATVETARIEGSAVGLAALECLTRMHAQFAVLLRGADLANEDDKRQIQLEAGIGPLWAGANAVLAQAQSLVEIIQAQAPAFIPDTQPLLNEEEKARVAECFRFAVEHLSIETTGRAQGSRKKKRGRRS